MLAKSLSGGSKVAKVVGTSIERARPVEIVFVMDRSLSMDDHRKEAISGFNAFMADQQSNPGDAVVCLRQFSDVCETTFDNVPLSDVKKLTSRSYVPNGGTALYDAIGSTISEVMTRHTATPISGRPSRTLVVILTDGEENASQEYFQQTVCAMVSRAREVFGWEFILIGMGIDAAEIAIRVGIDERKSFAVSADASGLRLAMATASHVSRSFRDDGTVPLLSDGRVDKR